MNFECKRCLVTATLGELGYLSIILLEVSRQSKDCVRKVDKDEKCRRFWGEQV